MGRGRSLLTSCTSARVASKNEVHALFLSVRVPRCFYQRSITHSLSPLFDLAEGHPGHEESNNGGRVGRGRPLLTPCTSARVACKNEVHALFLSVRVPHCFYQRSTTHSLSRLFEVAEGHPRHEEPNDGGRLGRGRPLLTPALRVHVREWPEGR